MSLSGLERLIILCIAVWIGTPGLLGSSGRVRSTEAGESVAIKINAAAFIRTIPETLYGANLTAWDGQTGSNTRFNNLIIASGRTEMRWPGGSWGDAFLWSDMEGPSGRNRWIVSYPETLNLLSKIGGRLQPIVNFPGFWHDVDHSHEEAVAAAVAWVVDQNSRQPSALYWEIGNEVGGPWEAGWQEGITTGSFYGEHFADFYLEMKKVDSRIRIGAVTDPVDGPDWWNPGLWTRDMLVASRQKGVVPDFLIIHAYPGSNRDANYNPELLSFDLDQIAIYTEDLNQIISEALGNSFVGEIPFWMTEFRAGGIDYSADDPQRDQALEVYPRSQLFCGALFLSQYLLEMATHGWEGSNSFGEFFFTRRGSLPAWYPYLGDYQPFPDWYVYPFLTQHFGRHLVMASSSDPLIRAYGSLDDNESLTLFLANNSPDQVLTTEIEVTGMVPAATGQRWLLQAAGQAMTGAKSPLQDLNDLSVNGRIHPDPLTVADLPGSSLTAGTSFQIQLPPSSMMFATIPADSRVPADTTPPSTEETEWKVDPHAIGDGSIAMEAREVSDPSGVEYSFICIEGDGHSSGWQTSPRYLDLGLQAGRTYTYAVATRDRSVLRNESPQSEPASATPVPVEIPVSIENASFELPGTGPQASWTTVPGWQSENEQGDIVVDQSFPTDGSWNARLKGLAGPVWNLTEHRIKSDSIVQLTFSARDYWNGSTRFKASLFCEEDGIRIPITSREFTLVRETRTYEVSFASDDAAESVGHRLGIEFANLRSGWAAIDNVRLKTAAQYQVLFPHFASGLGQLSSEIYFQNLDPGSETRVHVDFRDDAGAPVELSLNGLIASGVLDLVIPPGGLRVLRSSESSPLLTGSVTSQSDGPIAGVLLFGGRTGLAGVAGREDLSRGFVAPVEVRGSLQINTGLALMNPAELENQITLQICEVDGAILSESDLTLPGRGHKALFVTEVQWDSALDFSTFEGLLRVTSQHPVAATVLRTSPGELATFPVIGTVLSEDGDWIAGSLPESVEPLNESPYSFTFAHYGTLPGSLFSRILLFNLDPETSASFRLEFKGDNGTASRLTVNGEVAEGIISEALPPSGLGIYSIESADGSLASGSIRTSIDRRADGLVLFSGVVGVAGVGSSSVLESPFIGPVFQNTGLKARTGIALVNLDDSVQTFTLTLRDTEGASLGTASIEIPANGHRALFVDEIPFAPPIPMNNLEGTLKVVPNGKTAALMLQSRPGQLATLPVR